MERSPSVELNGDGFIAWTKNGILFRTGNQLQFIAFPYPIVFASPNLARTAAVVVMNWQDIALTQVVSVPSGAVLEQEFLGSIYEVGRVRLSPDANLVAVERTSQSPRAVYIWNRSMKEYESLFPRQNPAQDVTNPQFSATELIIASIWPGTTAPSGHKQELHALPIVDAAQSVADRTVSAMPVEMRSVDSVHITDNSSSYAIGAQQSGNYWISFVYSIFGSNTATYLQSSCIARP